MAECRYPQCAHEEAALEAERDAAIRERDRAVETRENANAVSLRVEAERDRYKAALTNAMTVLDDEVAKCRQDFRDEGHDDGVCNVCATALIPVAEILRRALNQERVVKVDPPVEIRDDAGPVELSQGQAAELDELTKEDE